MHEGLINLITKRIALFGYYLTPGDDESTGDNALFGVRELYVLKN
ncbi:hypothetical protein [Carboxylicivirga litoralis]|nr:hypothetical protein [Carboxylicivirga sp. A043]